MVKNKGFIGRDAVDVQRDQPRSKRPVSLRLRIRGRSKNFRVPRTSFYSDPEYLKADYHAERFSYSIDDEALERAEVFYGKLVLLSNVPDFEAEEIVTRYKSLADIERDFRVLKSDLEIAPVYHRLPDHIHAHSVICFLALVLYLVMRMRLKANDSTKSPKTALELLARIQKHRATIGEHVYTGISKTTEEQLDLFGALELSKP